jgi:hypothetical protein
MPSIPTVYGNTCHNGNTGRFLYESRALGESNRRRVATLNFRGTFGLDLIMDPPEMPVRMLTLLTNLGLLSMGRKKAIAARTLTGLNLLVIILAICNIQELFVQRKVM